MHQLKWGIGIIVLIVIQEILIPVEGTRVRVIKVRKTKQHDKRQTSRTFLSDENNYDRNQNVNLRSEDNPYNAGNRIVDYPVNNQNNLNQEFDNSRFNNQQNTPNQHNNNRRQSNSGSKSSNTDDHCDGCGNGIFGEAGADYPNFSSLPKTNFDCKKQQWPGYYADTDARCQVFWICQKNRADAFLCPNGTLFNQQVFVCDWWFNVDCGSATEYYSRNQYIYGGPGIDLFGNQIPIKDQQNSPVVSTPQRNNNNVNTVSQNRARPPANRPPFVSNIELAQPTTLPMPFTSTNQRQTSVQTSIPIIPTATDNYNTLTCTNSYNRRGTNGFSRVNVNNNNGLTSKSTGESNQSGANQKAAFNQEYTQTTTQGYSQKQSFNSQNQGYQQLANQAYTPATNPKADYKRAKPNERFSSNANRNQAYQNQGKISAANQNQGYSSGGNQNQGYSSEGNQNQGYSSGGYQNQGYSSTANQNPSLNQQQDYSSRTNPEQSFANLQTQSLPGYVPESTNQGYQNEENGGYNQKSKSYNTNTGSYSQNFSPTSQQPPLKSSSAETDGGNSYANYIDAQKRLHLGDNYKLPAAQNGRTYNTNPLISTTPRQYNDLAPSTYRPYTANRGGYDYKQNYSTTTKRNAASFEDLDESESNRNFEDGLEFGFAKTIVPPRTPVVKNIKEKLSIQNSSIDKLKDFEPEMTTLRPDLRNSLKGPPESNSETQNLSNFNSTQTPTQTTSFGKKIKSGRKRNVANWKSIFLQ